MLCERQNTWLPLIPAGRLSAFRLGCCLLALMLATDTTNLMRWSPQALYAWLRANPAPEEVETEDGGRILASHHGNLRQARRKVGSRHSPPRLALARSPRSGAPSVSPDPTSSSSAPAVPAGLTVPLRC
jgi:hypothetical protein